MYIARVHSRLYITWFRMARAEFAEDRRTTAQQDLPVTQYSAQYSS
jgi:hypothetical protein